MTKYELLKDKWFQMTRKRDQTIKSQNIINILERAKPGMKT